MGYVVIHFFQDLKDNNHSYMVGDAFPHQGIVVSDARIKELSTSNNKQFKPLIKAVDEVKQYTKTDINRMPIAELRELASENEIDGFEDISGAELKKAIIKALGV
jgi:hypothetical protein